ncbi:MAG: HdeD family acid-resistance protein [Terracidiphilus sp.]
MSIEHLRESLKQFTGLFVGSSIFMIVVGVLAIALPLAAGISMSIFVSWLIFLTGFAHLVYAFAARGVGGFAWRLVLGIVYVAGGLYLGFRPGLSLASFTLVVAGILFVEGLMQSLAYFSLRELPGSGWILVDGIVTLLLGLMIWLRWPSGSAWAIGTLVGINFLLSGLTRLGYSGTARKALA